MRNQNAGMIAAIAVWSVFFVALIGVIIYFSRSDQSGNAANLAVAPPQDPLPQGVPNQPPIVMPQNPPVFNQKPRPVDPVPEVKGLYPYLTAMVSRQTRTNQLGSGEIPFASVPEKGALLVGFEGSLGKFFNGSIIHSFRGIYQNDQGEFLGDPFGKTTETTYRVRAKQGFAVGAITVKAGLGIDGMSVTFMEVTDTGLNPGNAYESEWIGGMGGGGPTRIAGDGEFIVGFHGKMPRDPNSTFNGLGLVTVPARK